MTRMTDSTARIQAYDRRLAAIHESGHALVSLHLGYDADAWIYPREISDPLSEKTWAGHATMRNMPIECHHPHRRMVAIAGMVAERIWQSGYDEDYVEPYGWEDHLRDEDCMSPADWRFANCEPGEPDDDLYDLAGKVAGLLMTDLWPGLLSVSRALMRDTESIHSFELDHSAAQAA